METEHRFLGTPCTKTESAFSQGVVFFRLRPGKVMKSRFSFCNSFPREASDDLTQSMIVNALEGALVEAFSNKFPSRTTTHQCAQMSVVASSQCGGGNQELTSEVAWCVAQEMRLFF